MAPRAGGGAPVVRAGRLRRRQRHDLVVGTPLQPGPVDTEPSRSDDVHHDHIDDVHHDITPLLEWSARDEGTGEGDMPYPPDHPKMPGEPPRVQPSKKVESHWDEDGNRIAD